MIIIGPCSSLYEAGFAHGKHCQATIQAWVTSEYTKGLIDFGLQNKLLLNKYKEDAWRLLPRLCEELD